MSNTGKSALLRALNTRGVRVDVESGNVWVATGSAALADSSRRQGAVSRRSFHRRDRWYNKDAFFTNNLTT